jgi:ParB-like nuclease family protein
VSTPDTPETRVLALDEIVPYWRNPRVVTDDAVNAVAASIERYGYTQPMVVDAENVLIIGHTRYAALRRLGATHAPVMTATHLTPTQVKQLRVIDNKAHELTTWNFDDLVAELDDLDAGLMRAYFPDVVPDADSGPGFTAADDGDQAYTPPPDDQVEFTCPSCFHEFSTMVTREQVLSGRIAP